MTAGAKYILRESKAPDGFVTATDVSFTVKADGSITTVTMTDQQTVSTFNKVDESGNPVKGATLQLFEANGTKVAEWVTDGTAKAKLQTDIQRRKKSALPLKPTAMLPQ